MAVVECDFMISNFLHPLCLCVLVHMCMATCIFQYEVLLQLLPVQYYTCFQHNAEFKKCLLNIHQGYLMYFALSVRKTLTHILTLKTSPIHT